MTHILFCARKRAIGSQGAQRELQTISEEPKPGLAGAASSRFGFDLSSVPIHPPASQAKQMRLARNEPGDTYEKEADRVADRVIMTPASPAASGTRQHIQHLGVQTTWSTDVVPITVNHALAEPGGPMELTSRRDTERHLGHDFSRVRVHSDAIAERSARDVNVRAYTLGHDIVSGAGGFKPETHEGRWLIADELTHVIQQTGGAPHLRRRTWTEHAPAAPSRLSPHDFGRLSVGLRLGFPKMKDEEKPARRRRH